VLIALLAMALSFALFASPGEAVQQQASCGNVTLAQTEGPYFKANAPERKSFIEPGVTGTKLTLTGQVFSSDCKPIAKARLDFWQADDKGVYDNQGFKLRGHQFTDNEGKYALETIMPGLYPGRTRHIHVKIQIPNQPGLTTQLYFPNEPANSSDRIFNAALLVTMKDNEDGSKSAGFNFVLKLNN
jgi:protocatechuate 3,4-dioxygenase beta subunit